MPDMGANLTVEQVLHTSGLQKHRILAGRGGLGRELTRITVAETPDSLDWLEGGELVCTTGYSLINDPQLQKAWIQGMAEKNVAALIIKPERFFGSIPAHMIELAEQVNFPLIELPLDIIWPTVIEGIMNLMLTMQTERMRVSYNIYNQLTQLVLCSKGMQYIIDTISRLAKNPVVLEDRFLNFINSSHAKNALHRDYTLFRLEQPQRDRVKQLLGAHGETRKSTVLTLPVESPAGRIEQMVAPIIAGKHLFGYLTILVVDNHSLDSSMLKSVIQHGSTVLALELLNDNTRFQLNTAEKTGLLKMLTGDSMPQLSELRKRSGLLGIDLDLNTAVIVIHCEPSVTSYTFNRVENHLLTIDPNAVVFFENGNIVAFYHPADVAAPRRTMRRAESVTNLLIADLEREQYTCYAGIGTAYQQPESIRKSYFEAMFCMKKARAEQSRIVYHDYRSFESIIALVQNPDGLVDLAYSSLKSLIDYDKLNNTELITTLGHYISHKYNQAKTAKFMNIHINTLSYRLTRIQEILDVDLSDIESCTMLHFCLKILGAQEQL